MVREQEPRLPLELVVVAKAGDELGLTNGIDAKVRLEIKVGIQIGGVPAGAICDGALDLLEHLRIRFKGDGLLARRSKGLGGRESRRAAPMGEWRGEPAAAGRQIEDAGH